MPQNMNAASANSAQRISDAGAADRAPKQTASVSSVPIKLTTFSQRTAPAGTGVRSAEIGGVIPQKTQPKASPTEASWKYGARNSCGADAIQLTNANHDSHGGRPDCHRTGLKKTSGLTNAPGPNTIASAVPATPSSVARCLHEDAANAPDTSWRTE